MTPQPPAPVGGTKKMRNLVHAFELARIQGFPVELSIARKALLTAIAALEAQVDRERRSNAVLISAGNDLEAVSTATGINMERWFAYRDHWRNAVDEHSSPSPTGL